MDFNFQDSKYYKKNLLHRIADNLDNEINQYIIDILNGNKKIEGLDVTKIRWRLFKDFKDEIINNINQKLETDNKNLEIQLGKALNKNKFNLSNEQEENIENWKNTHNCKHRKKSQGAIGGQYTYEFIPTSIGVFCSVKCSCGNKIDISEV